MDRPVREMLPVLGVKMCGNCNPDIRSVWVTRQIAKHLCVELVPYEQAAVRLVVSACGAACVENAYPCPAAIRGLRLNGVLCEGETDLIGRTVELLEPLYHRTSPDIAYKK